jgi:enamine deaminase RidA (YjgF/YER057c/UK114 family)
MAGRIEARLQELGIQLPTPPAPVANYVPYAVSGKLVFIAGQVPFVDGKIAFTGKCSPTPIGGVSIERGAEAARVCFLNGLAQLKAAAGGDLDRVARIVQLRGYVACTPDFLDHPKVINGASDLAVAVFGEAGRHARAAVGVPSLPGDSTAEVEVVAELA